MIQEFTINDWSYNAINGVHELHFQYSRSISPIVCVYQSVNGGWYNLVNHRTTISVNNAEESIRIRATSPFTGKMVTA